MLKKSLDPIAGAENGKRSSRSWIAPDRGLLSSLVIIVLLPTALAAQIGSPVGEASPQPTVYGSGYQLPLEFEGERRSTNEVSLTGGISALYDDNVFSTNSDRVSDEAVSFDASLGIKRRTKHWTLNFNYLPFFVLYRQITEYDRTNHAANMDLSYRLSSRFVLGLQDTFSYQNGLYPTLAGQPILSGPPSPLGSTGIISPYTIRTLANITGLYLTFVKSRRTSITLAGGYNRFDYGTAKETSTLPLYNGTGFSGGLTFQHYVTAHTSLGFLLLHQDTVYDGGSILGTRQRSQVESGYLSFASTVSPSVTFTLFGGPQYVRSIGLVSPTATLSKHFEASGGGSITKQVRRTALDLSIVRSVTDGGGLYTSVVNSRVILGARQRLFGRWEGNLHVGASRLDTSLFEFVNGRIEGLIGGVSMSRPLLSERTVFHISYDTMHQLSKGPLPFLASYDRNQIAIGFDYQFKGPNLGR
jgi:hypothetical protein